MWDKNLTRQIESNKKKSERFPTTLRKYVSILIRIKGTLDGKYIIISISPRECNNYINNEFANELLIPETNN
jgi:hypothetical protein